MIELECVGGPWHGQKRSLFPGTTRLFCGFMIPSREPQPILTMEEIEANPMVPATQAFYELVIPRAPNQKNAFLAWMGGK